MSSSVHSGVTRPAKRNAARASDAPSQPPEAPPPPQQAKEMKTRSHGLSYLSGGLTVGALLFTAFGLLDGSGNEAMSSILLAVLVALFLFSLGPAQSCARCTTTVAAVAAAKKAAADAKVVTLVNIRQSVCVVREIFVPGNGKS